MLPDEKVKCHRTAFEKSCRDMVVNCHCQLWVHISGFNRNTGQQMDHYACVDRVKVDLTIENTQAQQSTAKAVESTRNEFVRSADRNMDAMIQLHDTIVQIAAHQRIPGLLDAKPIAEIEDKRKQ